MYTHYNNIRNIINTREVIDKSQENGANMEEATLNCSPVEVDSKRQVELEYVYIQIYIRDIQQPM